MLLGLISRYLCRKSKLYRLIEKIGIERASKVMASIVVETIEPTDGIVTQKKVLQFLREEFDAAHEAICKYGATKTFESFLEGVDSYAYLGACCEQTQYPIDGVDGPQRMLRFLIAPLMNDGKEGIQMGVEITCATVQYIRAMFSCGVFLPENFPDGAHYIDAKDCFGCVKNIKTIESFGREMEQISNDIDLVLTAYD